MESEEKKKMPINTTCYSLDQMIKEHKKLIQKVECHNDNTYINNKLKLPTTSRVHRIYKGHVYFKIPSDEYS